MPRRQARPPADELKVQASQEARIEGATAGNHDLPFAKELFEAADRLRGSVESAEYKHLVLGLLFLKYISDSFERRRVGLEAETRDPASDLYTIDDAERRDILEDRDEYISENVFWVPEGSRFGELLKAAAQPDIGQRIDRALEEIERDNPEQLRGCSRASTLVRLLRHRSSGRSSRPSARSASARIRSVPAICSGVPTSTSSRASWRE